MALVTSRTSLSQGAKTSAAYTHAVRGVVGRATVDATNTQNWTLDEGVRGVQSWIDTEADATGTIEGMAGFFAYCELADGPTVNNYYGFRIGTALVAGNKLVNSYGIYLNDFNTGTDLNYAIYTNLGLVHFGDALDVGDGTNKTTISKTGDITFAGTAGFYPRFLTQADEPAAGTGATQCDTSEMVVWKDSDDSKVYLCFNDGGTVKTTELA